MTLKSRTISFAFILVFLVVGFIVAANAEQKNSLNAETVAYGTHYTLSYDANGGENAPTYDEVKADGSFVISKIQPQKDGCTFLGWSCEKDATEASYTAGSNVYLAGNATVYAVWSR